MAITADQVQEAIAKFLPRSLDIARDADSGQLDSDQVAERALLIVKTALLFDQEAALHTLSLAVTTWGSELQGIVDGLSELASNDLLLSIQDQAPHYIDDVSQLEDAQAHLSRLRGTLLTQGVVSDNYFDAFVADVEGFVDDHVKANVQFRNRVVIRDEAKTVYAGIEDAWTELLEKKDGLTEQVADYVAVDVKALVAGEVILSIRTAIETHITDIQAADASEQAALAEQLLVDLAAAKAVLSLIKNAPGPEGTTVVGPAADGETPNDYLQRTGMGYPEPVNAVTLPSGAKFKSTGRPSIVGKILAGGYGSADDDGDGDEYTPDFEDAATGDFIVDGVEEGFFLFLAKTGMSYQISSVAATTLELHTEIPLDINPVGADDRYLITEDVIGTYFEDQTEDFLTEYTDGATGSNVVCSGTAGQYKEDVRLTGTNGSNSKSYSTAGDGESQPRKAEGSDGQPHGDYVTSGTGEAMIQMEGQSDGVAASGALETLSSAGAFFVTNNVQAGDWVYIDSGPMAGETYKILQVLGEGTVRVITPWSTPGSGLTYRVISASILKHVGAFTAAMVGKYVAYENDTASPSEWYALAEVVEYIDANHIRLDSDTLCIGTYADPSPLTGAHYAVVDTYTGEYDVFYSTTLDAFNNLIQPGDDLTISGYTVTASTEDLNGTWEILEVLDANRVRIDISGTFGEPSVGMTNETGLGWYVTRSDVDVTKLFYAPDGEFITGQVEAGDKLYIDDGTGADVGSSFTVDSVESETTLLTTAAFSGNQTDLEWHVTTATAYFFRDPDVMMYAGLLDDDNEFELVIDTSVPTGEEDEYGLDESDVGTYTLTTVDSLTNSDLYLYTDWKVTPADDKTWLFYQTDLDFSDYDGGGTALGPLVTLDGVLGQAYLVVGGVPTQIYYRILDDPYDASSSSSTLRLADRITASVPGAWAIWRGLTTTTFKDTVNSPFGGLEIGDTIRLDPGGNGQQDLIITEVVSSSEVTVAADLTPDQTGLTYALFASVRPGMELVTSGVRIAIEDIDSTHVLKLARPMPATSGKNLRWFVVLPGEDLKSDYLVDTDPAFIAADGFGTVLGGAHDWVEGSTVHIMGQRPLKAKVLSWADQDGDGVYETLILDGKLEIAAGGVAYKVLDFEEYKTSTFTTAEDLTGVAVGDKLTVWGISDVFSIEAINGQDLTVTPRISGGLESRNFVIVRDGAQAWGRYLLFEYLIDAISVATDLELFKLRLAEVVSDFGGTRIGSYLIAPGGGASLIDDEDGDSTTDRLGVAYTPTIAAGDRVDLTLSVSGAVFTYVQSVDHSDVSQSVLTLYREYDLSESVTDHSVYKNSVSYVLGEIASKLADVEALQEVTGAFTVPESSSMASVKATLTQSGLDAALDSVNSGDLATLAGMDSVSSSYTATALDTVNTVGQSTEPTGSSAGTSASSQNVSGSGSLDDAQETPVPAAAVTVAEEVETRIALSNLSAWLTSDAKLSKASTLSLGEMRDRRIFEISGEIESSLVADDDDTLPWLSVIGSEIDRLTEIEEAAVAALDYMIDNPDQFEDVETS